MTAHCPICGGKWEPDKYELVLRCGDEHDIICGYCNRTISFVMDKEAREAQYVVITTKYENYLDVLKWNIDDTKKELERAIKKIKELEKNG